LNGETARFDLAALSGRPQLTVMLLSTAVVGVAFLVGWKIYSKVAVIDPLEQSAPVLFRLLQNKFFIDELYAATVIRLNTAFSNCADWLDRVIWGGAVNALTGLTVLLARINRFLDELGINLCFDSTCADLREAGSWVSWIQNGRVQRYLRVVGVAFSLLLLALIWGCG
jgi:NADH-quinone oxidoreductase subunit L